METSQVASRSTSTPSLRPPRLPQPAEKRNGHGRNGPDQVARALGWFSLGLGLAEVGAPRVLARFIGLDADGYGARDVPRTLRLFGVREIATGLGLFSKSRPGGWLWARVAGDLMDLSFLGAAMRRPTADTTRLATAVAAVAGVTALDILCSQRLRAPRTLAAETEADGTVRLTGSLAVNRTPAECYAFWRALENVPRFMQQIESVADTGDGRSHWKTKAMRGVQLEWDAQTTQDEANELIAWRSVEGSTLETDGSVHFLPRVPEGTLVRLTVRYKPPGGALGTAVTRLFGRPAQQLLKQDLRRFKQLLETGDIITTANQSHGPPGFSATRAISRS